MLSWTHSSLALAGLHAASICRRDVQEDLQAWHANQSAAGTPRRKGPLIDPFSHGGYQGQPAPEWRPLSAALRPHREHPLQARPCWRSV